MYEMPHELAWGEVYFPPLLLVTAIAYLLAMATGRLVTELGLHKYVGIPAIAELSMIVIYIGILGRFINIY